MNRDNFILPTVILMVAGITLYFYRGPEEIQEMKRELQKQETHQNAVPVKMGNEEKPARTKASRITSEQITDLKKTFPDKEDVKAEVQNNPHTTPPSLVDFAKSLGPLMELALENSKDAEALVNVLYDCALDESVALSARALCVSDAERLANHHPSIKEKVSEIRTRVSPDVISLLKKRNLL